MVPLVELPVALLVLSPLVVHFSLVEQVVHVVSSNVSVEVFVTATALVDVESSACSERRQAAELRLLVVAGSEEVAPNRCLVGLCRGGRQVQACLLTCLSPTLELREHCSPS